MMQKVSGKTQSGVGSSNRLLNIIGFKGDMSELTRLYRKEEILKKKLKTLLDGNAVLQKEIKVHESQIKDQRASVQFQLYDLIKEMSLKLGYFNQQKLQRCRFASNEQAHTAMQIMMQRYEQIQKQCGMIGRIFDSIQKMQQNYQEHAKQMEDLVLQSEGNTMQYEMQMFQTLSKIGEQINNKSKENEETDKRTQILVKEIDNYITGAQELKQEEEKVIAKIDRLKKMATCQQQKVDQIKQWAAIVIDRSNQKAVQKTIKQKHRYLDVMKQKNDQLQIYLCELMNEEAHLLYEKENEEFLLKSPAKSKRQLKSKPKKNRA